MVRQFKGGEGVKAYLSVGLATLKLTHFSRDQYTIIECSVSNTSRLFYMLMVNSFVLWFLVGSGTSINLEILYRVQPPAFALPLLQLYEN